jgi:uncharacterized protein YbaP (TraB family)
MRRRELLALAALAALPRAAASAAPERFQRGRLWRVEGGAARPPSWIFGTIHVADERVLALPPAVERAFAVARVYAFEAAPGREATGLLLEAGVAALGQRVQDGLDAAEMLVLSSAAPQVPVALLGSLKPWAALINLTAPTGNTDETLDARLLAFAVARRMPGFGLELPEEQIEAFESIPLEVQWRLLRHALANRVQLQALVEPSIRAWLAGDLAGLHALQSKAAGGSAQLAADYALLNRKLVIDRSAVMAHRLFLPLRRGGVFVAVGALHLYGGRSLLAEIEAQGHRVRLVAV